MTRILALLALLLPSIAMAHDWYPAHCCSGQDCQPISGITVAFGFSAGGEEGYHVLLRPSDHKMIERERRYFVPMRSVLKVPETAPREQQNQFHACIGKATKMLLCFYAPGREYVMICAYVVGGNV